MDGWSLLCRTGHTVVFYYVLCFKKAPQQDSVCPEISRNDWRGVLFQVAKFLYTPLAPLMNKTLETSGMRLVSPSVCSLVVAAKLWLLSFFMLDCTHSG